MYLPQTGMQIDPQTGRWESMETLSVLANWPLVSAVVGACITIGIGVLSMTPPQYFVARIALSLGAVILLARSTWYLGSEAGGMATAPRVFGAVALFALVGGLWVGALVWINSRAGVLGLTPLPAQPSVEQLQQATVPQVKQYTFVVTRRLREFQREYDDALYRLSANHPSAVEDAHSEEQRRRILREESEAAVARSIAFGNERLAAFGPLKSDAVLLIRELWFRHRKPPLRRGDQMTEEERNVFWVLFQQRFVGPKPVNVVADYLDNLAKSLPESP
jgi:hypothetical protein